MDLQEVLAAQDGVFTEAQAREAGYSPYQIRRRKREHHWTPVVGTVLCISGAGPSVAGLDRAANLAGGRGAVSSGPSAARLQAMTPMPGPACVTLPRRRHLELPGVLVLREPVADDDLELVDGMLVTGRPRTVVDCLRVLELPQATTYLDRALQQRWICFDELVRRVQGHAGRHGARKLVRLVRAAGTGTRSEGERLLRRLLRSAGIVGWRVNQLLYDAAGCIGEVDVVFPALRLAIEVDGRAWHSSGERFQRDRTKQNRLVAAGWTVLRFTWEDLTQRPDEVLARIRTVLAGRP